MVADELENAGSKEQYSVLEVRNPVRHEGVTHEVVPNEDDEPQHGGHLDPHHERELTVSQERDGRQVGEGDTLNDAEHREIDAGEVSGQLRQQAAVVLLIAPRSVDDLAPLAHGGSIPFRVRICSASNAYVPADRVHGQPSITMPHGRPERKMLQAT